MDQYPLKLQAQTNLFLFKLFLSGDGDTKVNDRTRSMPRVVASPSVRAGREGQVESHRMPQKTTVTVEDKNKLPSDPHRHGKGDTGIETGTRRRL